jgi:glycogen debranching enzyme
MAKSRQNKRGRGDKAQNGIVAPTRRYSEKLTRVEKQARQTPLAQRERKHRVLAKGQSAIVSSIANAVTIKDINLYYVIPSDGQLPLQGEHGFGLYFHDCRFLNGYEMLVAGVAPVVLASTAEKGHTALFELTNPDLHLEQGQLMPKEELGVGWERLLDAEQMNLQETITFRNFGQHAYTFPVTLSFRAGFDDVFTVRELVQETLGRRERPVWKEGKLRFVYHGADQIRRTVTVTFSPAPHITEAATAHFHISVSPGETQVLAVSVDIDEQSEKGQANPNLHPLAIPPDFARELLNESQQWPGHHAGLQSDSLLLNSVFERSLRDLDVLRSRLGANDYICAGVPWFVALFGRDSLIVALEMLPFWPELAAHTLRLLATYQGRRVDDWRDEQPGKILHEIRVGELARTGEIPHTPFYGTVDATPLFLLLLGRHAAWTGDLGLFHELRASVEGALAWIARFGDSNGDGYVDYQSTSEEDLINQGWKDSGDSIVRADGTLAAAPIALVEVQGYVFAAKCAIADLYERVGELPIAKQLRREARMLRSRFNRDFWWEDQSTYLLALEEHGRRVAVVSSNPGQALWTGIADPDKAKRTVARLMADDMFSGWGVRTLSTKERRYNPVGYHLGTVWPHDNALIAAGCRRYGNDAAALRILSGLVESAMHFRHQRLPEVFAGFAREHFQVPVHYPVACHPQAWAAGAVPFLVTSCLGLEPDGFADRLRIVRPLLPDFVDRIELSGIRVGRGVADLHFKRIGDGISVDVLRTAGRIDVMVETK